MARFDSKYTTFTGMTCYALREDAEEAKKHIFNGGAATASHLRGTIA